MAIKTPTTGNDTLYFTSEPVGGGTFTVTDTGGIDTLYLAGSGGTNPTYIQNFPLSRFTINPVNASGVIVITGASTKNNSSFTFNLKGIENIVFGDGAGGIVTVALTYGPADTTPPTASVTTATIRNVGNAVVQSTEVGTAYLVNSTVTVSNVASITSAADALWNSVAITTANTNTNLAATGLGDGTYKVYAVDAAGNLSAAAGNTVTIDTTPDAAPAGLDLATVDDTGSSSTDNVTKLTTGLTFTGTGVTGSVVTLFDDANGNGVVDAGESLGTATVAGGTWSIDASLAAGSHSPKAVQMDAAGNVSVASAALPVTVDTTAPAVAITSGAASNMAKPVVSGTAEAGASISAVIAGATYTTTATAGSWSVNTATATPTSGTLSLNVNGSNSISVTATDIAGNASTPATQTLVLDAIPPTASVTAATIRNVGNAVVQSTEVGTAYLVNSNNVTVTTLSSITSAADNLWNSVAIAAANANTNLAATGLSDGIYKVYAVDAAGNLSVASNNSVTIDTTPDAAPAGLDLATVDDTGSSSTDNVTKLTTGLTFTGTGVTGSVVTLFDDANGNGVVDAGESLGTATVAGGTWSIDASLAAGSHSPKAVQMDAAGNVSVASAALPVTVDTTAPAVAITSGAASNMAKPVVSGTAEAGASISAVIAGATYTTTATAGSWSVNTATATPTSGTLSLNVNGSNSISVTATDIAGNASTPATQTLVLDTVAPTASVTAATIRNLDNAVVQSSEVGTAYLVKSTVTVSSVSSITSSADNLWNSTPVATANTNTNLAATGLIDGAYKVYSVDAAGNLSVASNNSVTIDTTAPTVSTYSPADNAPSVTVPSSIVLTFSESIQKGTGTIVIHTDSATGTAVESYNVATNTTNLIISGSTLTIMPSAMLSQTTHYFVTIDGTAIKDVAGNLYAGASTYDFTTAAYPNNNAPVLTVPASPVSLPELSPAGTQIGQATATDPDPYPMKVFSLVSPPTNGSGQALFAIDSSSGIISVTAAGASTIDYESATKSYSLTVKVSDGLAAHDQTGTVTVNITNVNEAPVIASALTSTKNEGDVSYTLDLLTGATDPDNGDTLGVASVTYKVDSGAASSTVPTGLTLTGNNLTVDPSNAAFNSLALGQSKVIEVNYSVADNHGATTPQTATITINGTNDAPTVSGPLAKTFTEGDAAYDIILTNNAADVDNGDRLSVTSVTYKINGGAASATIPAGLTLTGNSLKVDPASTAFDSLGNGQTKVIEVDYLVTDNNGGTVAQTATITVNGVNDLPTGSVTIGLDPVNELNLIADTSTLADAEGLGTLHYQWYRDGVATVTTSTYTPAASASTHTISVDVSYTDLSGHGELVHSASYNLQYFDPADPTPHIIDASGSTTGSLLFGGAGDDSITGGDGGDLIYSGAGNDVVHAGAGDDLIIGGSGAGNDTFDGNTGSDTVSYTSALAAIKVDLAAGTAGSLVVANDAGIGNDTLIAIENIIAGDYGDQLTGNSNANKFTGGAGNDTIVGGGGNDTAVYSGNRAEYTVVYNAATDTFTITDNTPGRDGTDTVSGVELFQFHDVTTELVPPTVTAFSPTDGATNVGLSDNIVLTFSEAIQIADTSGVVLHSDSVSGTPVAASLTLSVDSTVLTIDPTANLANGTHYYVTFADGSVLDLHGNHYGAHSDYDFTTIAAAVSASGGSGGGAGVALAGAAAIGVIAWLVFS